MNLLGGISHFTQGVSDAYRPKYRHFIALPAAVSFVIIGLGLWAGLSYITDTSDYLVGQLPQRLGFLEWLLKPLLYLLGILTGAWMFGLIATIVGSPFLGELALRVDQPTDVVDSPWWQQIWPALRRELRKLRYHLPRLVMLLVISIVPVLNTVAPALWLAFGAWMMAVQFCDFFNENRGVDFPATLDTLSRNRAAALGFGLCTTLVMSIPLINFLFIPAAVVGGTRMMRELTDLQGRISPS